MFSSRLRQAAGANRLAMAVERRRAGGRDILDLTLSNPTRAGFSYPHGLLAPMSQDRALCYQPEPFGLPSAREAVSRDLERYGVRVPPERIVLTASTSEAYSLLFKLLCDPADIVLAPQPCYPLIEHLTDLESVALQHYRLEFHGRWEVDLYGLREQAAAERTRAIIVINPNNPTGSSLNDRELDAVASIARERDLALISDEVFSDYRIAGDAPCSAARQSAALTFTLGGLSKSIGLPQLKLGWIAVGGPEPQVAEALERLEIICDAYLSVSTPVQLAVPELLGAGGSVRAQIHNRVRENYDRLKNAAAAYPACAVLPVEAGWYAIVQVPALAPEERIAVDLLEETGVLVHPGYFFDFEREAFLVVSLLPEARVFVQAIDALFDHVGRLR